MKPFEKGSNGSIITGSFLWLSHHPILKSNAESKWCVIKGCVLPFSNAWQYIQACMYDEKRVSLNTDSDHSAFNRKIVQTKPLLTVTPSFYYSCASHTLHTHKTPSMKLWLRTIRTDSNSTFRVMFLIRALKQDL